MKRKIMLLSMIITIAVFTVACRDSNNKTEDATTPTEKDTDTDTGTESESITKESTSNTEEGTTTKDNKKDLLNIEGVYAPEISDIQITIKKDKDILSIVGDGMKGDKFGEFSGVLKQVADNKYEMNSGDNKLEFVIKNKTIEVTQTGVFGDEGFSFDGTYTKIRD